MGNFLNNGPKILKLIVRVRIYHIGSVTVEVFVPGEFDMQDHSG